MLESLDSASAVIYSIGSLYTSIIPCLILKGVGERIRSGGARYKILILNGSLDRETRATGWEFSARDFVEALGRACKGESVSEEEWKRYVTHVIYLEGEGTPRIEREVLARAGVECVRIYGRKREKDDGDGGMIYDGTALGQALEAIIGGGKRGLVDRSRRNTLGISGVAG